MFDNIQEAYTTYNSVLVNFCINYLNVSRQEAEDLVQEAFLKLLEREKKSKFKPINYSFLRKMVTHIFIDQRRKHQKKQKTLENYQQFTQQRAEHHTEIDIEKLHNLVQEGNFLNDKQTEIWQIYCQQGYDRQNTARIYYQQNHDQQKPTKQELKKTFKYVDPNLSITRKKIRANIAFSSVIKSWIDLYELMKEP